MKDNNSSLCRIVAAGDFSPAAFSERAQKEPEALLIAADAGYLHLEKAGIVPDLFVGDADSLGFFPENVEILSLPSVKDDTDTISAIKEALERGCRRFELFGALGGNRLSHTIANLQTLLFLKDNGAQAELIGDTCAVRALRDERVKVSDCAYFSVFAAGESAEVSFDGAKYPLEKHIIRNSFPLGVSNEPLGNDTFVEVSRGTVFLVIEK